MVLKEVQGTEIIKFAAEAYMGMGGSPMKLLIESAEWLYDCYQKTEDNICLEAALQIAYAYMELGLIYEEAQKTFDKIVASVGKTNSELFPRNIYAAQKLKLKQSKICEILGRWPHASQKQYNAEWVSKDIIYRVQNKVLGCQYYEKGIAKVAFELLILDDNAYLLDLEKKKIYVFDIE